MALDLLQSAVQSHVRVAYLSYDGALDPLGATQVVPYLERLAARGIRYELITFEKPDRLADSPRKTAMAARLDRAGIGWHPLTYHRSPRVPATLFDVIAGAMQLRRIARGQSFGLFHCRGEIPPVMVRLSLLDGPLLLDMRGFFSDERVDAGSWAAGSLVDRAVRATEQRNLARSSSVVVLTERGRAVLRSRGIQLPIEVIPTCVDIEAFRPAATPAAREFDLVYFGSLGGWYMTDEMIGFVRCVRASGENIRVLFLTNNADAARRQQIERAGIVVEAVAPDLVPNRLSRCCAAFFFIRATPSKMASCPTKLAEALAMGLPILTNPGVGDVDSLLRESNVGVTIENFSSESFLRGWKTLRELMSNPEISKRCRDVATTRLSVTRAADLYERTYRQLSATKRAPASE